MRTQLTTEKILRYNTQNVKRYAVPQKIEITKRKTKSVNRRKYGWNCQLMRSG